MTTHYIYRLALAINGTVINPPGGIVRTSQASASTLVQLGLGLAFLAGIILTTVYLIQAGIQWMTSRGDKQLLDQARLRITYAVVGLIIILSAFFVVNVIFGFFNIKFP